MFKEFLRHLIHTLTNERGDFGSGGSNDPTSNLMWPLGSNADSQISDATAGMNDVAAMVMSQTEQTPGEKTQYGSSFDIGKLLSQYELAALGLGQLPAGAMTPEQQLQAQGPLGSALYQQGLTQAQDPYAGWESSLQPNLQLATQNVNQQANQRGLLQSGIGLEQMGRAGVEAAVADAQNRMTYGQQSFQNAMNVGQGAAGLGQQNIANLSGLYGQQQGYGLQSMNRQAQGAEVAGMLKAYPYQAQMGSGYGSIAAQQALPGQLIGAAGTIGSAMMLA